MARKALRFQTGRKRRRQAPPPLPNRFSFAPLFPDIALRLNGTGETLLSLSSLLSLLTELSEKWPRISRNTLV